MALETEAFAGRGQRCLKGLAWFEDLEFRLNGTILERKTGRIVTFEELTPRELWRFLCYLAVLLAESALAPKRAQTIAFTPSRPNPWYVIWSAAKAARLRIAADPDDADLVFYFEDATIGTPPTLPGRKLLNAGVADISKSNVAEMFERAAGYPLRVDPTLFHGEAVEKSEVNGAHDGRIVACPRAPQLGKSYQLLIEACEGEVAIDYRTTIINRRPRFVVVKRKPKARRFSIHNGSVQFAELDACFSADEQELLARFARLMELDWAAIDVLRDRESGRIYVVDVNKTDTGPAVDLSFRDQQRLKEKIAEGLLELVAEHAPRNT